MEVDNKLPDFVSSHPHFIGALESTMLAGLPRPQNGELVFCKDTSKVMIYENNEWHEFNQESGLKMNLYELNKSVISQLPNLDNETILAGKNLIQEFTVNNNNTYYMLYGYEINYFTLFKRSSKGLEAISDVVIDCLNNIGPIKSIDLAFDKSAVEIWVESEETTTLLYLFPYDLGVVEVSE